MNVLRIVAIPLIGLLLIAVLVYTFLRQAGISKSPGAPILNIQADAALRLPLESPDIEHEHGLLGRFERRTGIRIHIAYVDPKPRDAEQVSHREIDLVLTSRAHWIHRLEREGAIASKTPIGQHMPVILMHESSRMPSVTLDALRNPNLRLATADLQGTDLGQLTIALLTDDTYTAEDLRQHVRYTGDTVDEVAQAVQQHRVDVAMVWKDVALRHAPRTTYNRWPDPAMKGPIVYALCLKHASQGDAAAQLARFLAGPAAIDLLLAYGFAAPERRATAD